MQLSIAHFVSARRRDRGREGLLVLPALRTGRADLPHPALQSVVLPTRGLTGLGMALLQAVEAMLGKEGIWPSVMIGSVRSGDALTLRLFPQHASQPAADPAVERFEDPAVAVLEVFEPAPQDGIHAGDDLGQALSGGALGLGSDVVLELSQALLPRPAFAGLEAVAQEIKAIAARIDEPGLVGMQRQPGLRRPLPHRRQRRGRLLRASTQHHEVVGVAHHLEALPCHQMVEWVEIDVAQQRAYHGPLRRAIFGGPFFYPPHNSLLKESRQNRKI